MKKDEGYIEREGKKEIFAFLGFYAALFDNCLSTFWDTLSAPSSWAA